MPQSPSLVGTVAEAFAASGIDLAALGLAWARALPAVTLVPAFGLRALPLPARAVFGLALAASIFPALVPLAATSPGPWALIALGEVLRGLPVAIAAAVPLWAATMAGGLVDALRGGNDQSSSPVVEGRTSPLGVFFALFSSALFLLSGGAARVASALAARPLPSPLWLAVSHDLVAGIGLAVSIAAPLLSAAILLEIAAALMARAASPAQVHALLAPLRSLGILAVAALVFERLSVLLAQTVASAP